MSERETHAEASVAAPSLILAACLASFAACGAVLVPGLRLLDLTAGTTSAGRSAVLAAAVLGLAIGALVGTRAAPRRPVLSLAGRQVLLASLLALAPLLFAPIRWLYLALWPLLGGWPGGTWILRLVLGAGLLLLPALAAGLLFSAIATMMGSETGERAIGSGFVISLAAAGLGTGLAVGGVVLVPVLGMRGTWLVGLSLAGLAASVTLLLRRSRAGDVLDADEASGGTGGTGPEVVAGGAWSHAAAVLTGMSLATALFGWERTIALIAGPTGVNSLITTALLFLGLAIGAFLVLLLRNVTGPAPAASALAAAALAAHGSMFLVPWLSTTYVHLAPRFVPESRGVVLTALLGAVLVVPGALLSGLALALTAARARAGSPARAPVVTLVAFAGGAALAGLLAPLILIPEFGLRRALSLAAAVVILGALTLVGEMASQWGGARGTAILALLAVMVVVGGFPASWDPRIVAGGLYRYAGHVPERFGSTDAWLQARLRGQAPLFYREGSEACVVVENSVQSITGLPDIETWTLTLDGRASASSGTDLRSQVLAGEIPILLHGPTDKVLVVDFLTGVTAGSVLRHTVKSLTVIEREPAVLAAGALFRELANAPLDDGRVATVTDDPRARLAADRTRYDVIVLTGVDPWLPHAAGLVTREGYALLRDRLAEGGLLAQRVSLSAAPEGATRTMLRTFARTFASVEVFQLTPDDLLVVGSDRPFLFDAGRFRSITGANAAVASDLQRVVALGPNEVVMTLRLGGDALGRMLGDGPINDDDHAPVTVAAARDLSVHRADALVKEIDAAWGGFGALLTNYGATPKEKADFLYNLAKSYLGLTADPVRALDLAKELAGMGETARARWVTGEARLQQKDLDGAVHEWESVLAIEPDNVDALFSLGMFYLDGRDYFGADRYLARAVKVQHEAPVVLYHYGRNLVQLGKYREAIDVLRRARELATGTETYPLVDYLVGISQLRLGKDADAAHSFKDYLDWAYKQDMLTRVEVDAHLKLADALEGTGKRFEALQERQKANTLQQRINAYGQSQQPGATQRSAPAPPAAAQPAAPAHGG